MTAGLSLMKIASTALAKSFLLPFGLSAGMSVVDAAIQKKKKKKKKKKEQKHKKKKKKKKKWIRHNSTDNFEWRNERCNENS